MIVERVKAGLGRARSQGKRLGRPAITGDKERRVRDLLAAGTGLVKPAEIVGVGVSAVQRIKATIDDAAHAALSAELQALSSSPAAPEA